MNKEFKATHYWIEYPGIYFEVDKENMKVRAKGKNDSKCTNWVKMSIDHNGIMYFTMKRERFYEFNLAKI